MTISTVNLSIEPVGREARHVNVGVDGATHIYRGTLLAQLTATGMLVPLTTASSGPCVGVACNEADATAVADAVKECKVAFDCEFRFANGLTTDACSVTTPLGSAVYGLDDHTVADNSNAGTLPFVGFFRGMEPDGYVRVYIPMGGMAGGGGGSFGQAADVGALTDNTTGVADDTLAAIPNPADTPASADALRDDLVANALPAIRNNFADLADAFNDMRDVLRAAGIMA